MIALNARNVTQGKSLYSFTFFIWKTGAVACLKVLQREEFCICSVQFLKDIQGLKQANDCMRYTCPLSLDYQSERLDAIRKIIHRELVLKSQLSHIGVLAGARTS